jgi:HEAT repeat protein
MVCGVRCCSLLFAGTIAAVALAVPPARAEEADETRPSSTVPAVDDETLGTLIETLRSGDGFRVRATAAVALGRIGDSRALPVLEEVLRGDENYAVRSAACTALGRLADPSALPALVAAAGDTDEYVRAAAEESLARFHTPQLLFSFRELLSSSDPAARRAAVLAYGDVLRAPESSAGLATFVINALADDNEAVVAAAEGGLMGLSHDRLVPLLLQGLLHGDSGVRARCARLLEQHIDQRAVEPLITVVLDTDSTADVRTAAKAALVKHAEYLNLKKLVAEAAGAAVAERVRALRVLAAIADPRATQEIDRALADVDPAVRTAGARAAADLGGGRARAALENALARETDPRQKRQLELLLKTMARPRSSKP